MDPGQLIGPPAPLGYPAPYWVLAFFKVLGFTLHLVPMNLWLAGTLLAMLLRWRGGEHARTWSGRMMAQMPIILALGINFGIVPLLFTQVAYARVFYPATILMAWPWFGVIAALVVAYYGVYLYAVGLRTGRLGPWRQAAGWAAAILFVAISFVFSNAFSLMTRVEAWPALWQRTSVAGAPLGVALNTGDPTLLPRWLMVLGLALTTTAAYAVVDAGLFAAGETSAYRRWAAGFGWRLYTLGVAWVGVAGSWYVFWTWPAEIRQMMLDRPLVVLTAATALSPGLPWLLLLVGRRGITPALAVLVGAAQIGVLAANALSRQIVQNAELRRFLDVTAERTDPQWGPLGLFLVLFVAGLAVVGWMVSKAIAASRRPAAPASR
ncbi:MAG: hypothetical protein QN168_10320 [Armatimonadota bacterium]|nr:hypothetical protein [Armatimonadota bacterium]